METAVVIAPKTSKNEPPVPPMLQMERRPGAAEWLGSLRLPQVDRGAVLRHLRARAPPRVDWHPLV